MPKSVMVHQFSQVPQAQIPRSVFDRSHGYKTTFNSGLLIPFFWDEALPGDTFNLRATMFGRMATPIRPFMDNVFLETFFFAVPYRLLWTNFQRFMGEQDNPTDSTDYQLPKITADATEGDIYDYMGIPPGLTGKLVSALPFRAYTKVWSDWFRDQNIQQKPTERLGDGPDASSGYILRRRNKKHDYFTSQLPWPQKGPQVTLPLGSQAPVKGIGTTNQSFSQANATAYETGGVSATYAAAALNATHIIEGTQATGGFPEIYADLSEATSSTINQLRQAFQIQRMQERDARSGTRYIEVVQAHFGVTSPDARQQRSEYLGGGSSMININPVAQTSETATGSQTPQGNLAAYATVSAQGHGFTKSFTEHCIVIGLVNVRADLTYQQGIRRGFLRNTKYDLYWPSLAQIGEQTVESQEIYADGTATDEDAMGYQERYAEYRYFPSMITGKFRSVAQASLDTWHLAQNFEERPFLNGTFIVDNPPIERVIAVQDEPQFLLDTYFQYKCARPMPTYGVPGMIDHF